MNPVLRAITLVLLAGASLAACAPATPGPRASAAQSAACRQRADEVYDRQNRAEIYRADVLAGGTRDAAFSSTGAPGGGIQAQLAARFARDRLLDECLRGVAGNVGSTPDAPIPVRAAP